LSNKLNWKVCSQGCVGARENSRASKHTQPSSCR